MLGCREEIGRGEEMEEESLWREKQTWGTGRSIGGDVL